MKVKKDILVVVIIFLLFLFSVVVAESVNDVGEVQFSNSGPAAAQHAFLRGLALLHNFEYEDAAAEFRKAQDLASGFAMAFWGEALTYNHPIWMEQDQNAALAAMNRLGPTPEARLAKAGTQREKDFLQAVEILYGKGSKEERDFAYAETMQRLLQKYPKDPDVAAFSALSLLGTAHHGRDFTIYMRAAAILEEVFKDYPNHPGAVHYLIHCYDDPIHAPLGLRPARVYSKIAPSAGHAQHMTSHIFLALGMWDDVVSANENAVRVVDVGRKEKGEPPSACGHYNFWLMYGYLQQGRAEQAEALLARCRTVAEVGAANVPSGMQMLDPDNTKLGSLVQMWARYVLDTEGWKGEVADWKIPATKDLNPQITSHWVAGLRAIHRGELDRAREELEQLKQLRTKLSTYTRENKEVDASYVDRADILESQLNGMLLIATKQPTEGINLLQQAATKEESLPMDFGPPFIDKPTRELLGEAFLQLQRFQDAVPAFEAALQRAPERTASLLGLARAASASGDKETASHILVKLRQIWKNADRVPDDMR
jgi:tetratricopeptide (TPR) repeat protein